MLSFSIEFGFLPIHSDSVLSFPFLCLLSLIFGTSEVQGNIPPRELSLKIIKKPQPRTVYGTVNYYIILNLTFSFSNFQKHFLIVEYKTSILDITI